MAKRNYAHCPLKKRPLAALYEQEQPEDLSIKKPKIEPELRVPKVEVMTPVSYTSAALTPPPASSPPANMSAAHPPANMSAAHPTFANLQRQFSARSSSPSSAPSFIPTGVSQYNSAIVQNSVRYHQQHSSPVSTGTRHVLPATSYALSAPVRQRTFVPPVVSSQVNNSFNNLSRPVAVSTPPSANYAPSRPSSNGGTSMPNLAEYYLQLFRATSEAETNNRTTWIPSVHMPLSPQASPRSPDQLNHMSPVTHHYPETSALISPASSVSTISESEEEPLSPTGSLSSSSSGTGKARYSCSDCGKAYATKPGLAKHKELHCAATLGARAYSCPTCNKSYTSCGALKMHIRTHTLPCKCHVCGKAFSRPWLLQGHIRTHTGEKPFQCSDCHRSFADRSNLRAHQQTHATVKKYACPVCTKTFSRMSLLNKHKEGTCTPGCPNNDIEEEEELDVVGDDDWSQE